MPITQEQFEEIKEAANTLESAFNDFDTALRQLAPNLYDSWKAYGKQVSNEFVSMGPCMSEVIEQLEQDIGSDNNEDEETCITGTQAHEWNNDPRD